MFAAPAPAIEQACDIAGARAEATRLDDQAFAAMRAATEAVDAAARGQGGAEADALWADYKRLRLAASRLRDQPCAPPPAAPLVQAPQTGVAARPYAGVSPSETSSPRFRVEGAVALSDRQPTRASRLSVQRTSGLALQSGGSYYYTPPEPPPPQPPPPNFPTPTKTTASFSPTGASLLGGRQPDVRSWSNGLDLALNFAPQGLDAAGWRFRGSLSYDEALTKSSIAYASSDFENLGTPTLTFACYALRTVRCEYARSTPVTLDSVILPSGWNGFGGVQDTVRQEAQSTDARLNVSRQFGVSALGVPLRVRLGAELGAGWWLVHERELLLASGLSRTYTRDVHGPTGLVGLTTGVGGDLWGPFRWSIDGMIGRQTADLTYFWNVIGNTGDAGNVGRLDPSTQRKTSSETIGSLAGRVDVVRGRWNGFFSVERRRDLSVASSLTGADAADRYAVRFPDGSRAGVWPVYSSRLRAGVGYSF